MNTFEKLERLSQLALKDFTLREKLIATQKTNDPLDAFCTAAQEVGIDLSIGELFAIGQEYSDNQCKSTNGGNPTPYDSFNDAYDTFLSSLK